jgi:hypothetical protein
VCLLGSVAGLCTGCQVCFLLTLAILHTGRQACQRRPATRPRTERQVCLPRSGAQPRKERQACHLVKSLHKALGGFEKLQWRKQADIRHITCFHFFYHHRTHSHTSIHAHHEGARKSAPMMQCDSLSSRLCSNKKNTNAALRHAAIYCALERGARTTSQMCLPCNNSSLRSFASPPGRPRWVCTAKATHDVVKQPTAPRHQPLQTSPAPEGWRGHLVLRADDLLACAGRCPGQPRPKPSRAAVPS